MKAKKFIANCSKKVIVKSVGKGTVTFGNQALSIFTTEINKSHNLSLIKNCPTLIQENIRKKSELRITIIGRKIFAVEYNSQRLPEAKTDSRRAGAKIFTIPHRVVKLPKQLEKKLLALLDYYGLHFGAIDMAKTLEDDYVFFELNPAGQFLWLEDITGLPLASEMAKFLLGRK